MLLVTRFASAQSPTYVPSMSFTGAPKAALSGFFAVTADSQNRVIVGDTNEFKIKVFQPDGTPLATFGVTDGGGMSFPPGADWSNCAMYDAAGNLKITFAVDPATCFSAPMGVAVDSRDRIYVADAGNHRVVVLCPVANSLGLAGADYTIPGCTAPSPAATLQYLTSFGTFGGPIVVYDPVTGASSMSGNIGTLGELDQPTDVAIDRRTDRIYVLDSFNSRVQAFSLTSTSPYTFAPQVAFGAPGEAACRFNQPQGLGVDQVNGTIAVAEYQNNFVNLFSPTGQCTRSLGTGTAGSTAGELPARCGARRAGARVDCGRRQPTAVRVRTGRNRVVPADRS
jgi:DNA-binding beta-propeller fold protein YncE